MATSNTVESFHVRFTGKNYSSWEFQFQLFVTGKELLGHIDGSDPAPKDAKELLHWKVRDARVMTWILGSVDPLIASNLRSSKTAKAMWDYLKKVYNQDNAARRFQLESDIANYSQGNLSIQEYYSGFQNLWAEFTDTIYAKVPAESLPILQEIHEQSKRDQFLMKLRSEFETLRSNLMSRVPSPSLDICFGELLREEQRFLIQNSLQQENTVKVAFAAQGRGKGRDMSRIQCYNCKNYGHIAANCGKKFCNYCKQSGHVIKECPTRPQNRKSNAAPIAPNNLTHFAAPTVSTTPSSAAEPVILTPEMVQQMIISAFSALGLQDAGTDNFLRVFEKKMDEKHDRLKESGRELAVSWALCAVCLFGHLSHIFALKLPWINLFHSTGFHLSLSLFTLLGPGRQLILDGMKSLFKGAPNMNTLVGLGALSSFTVSSLAALIPSLGWKAFFEEPIMLIAFVLLGRNLEQRAKIKATSDMTGLLSILPSKARLLVHCDAKGPDSIVEVPSTSLSIGDQIVVRPGDRVPADGIVKAGRSTIDESSFTGEPLPVTKLPGSQVAAGSINLNGTLTVEVRRPGGETAIGDIIRLVEEAQSREAPVQRLADKVSGQFTYGVMALSAATFMFWNLFGTHVLPAIQHGNPVSLALQLSCSVLVIACPCALGLATPTAVLVGTSLGATRGLLLRGGSILEKFSMVKTIVFDKTGTLTVGRPVVTKILTLGGVKITDAQLNSNSMWSEGEVLKLAAAVESNTVHPVGKAIVEAAQAVGHQNVKVADGTFMEEPGSGAVATIENKKVSVGTLDWVQRHGVYQNPFQEVEDVKEQSVVYVGVDDTLAGLIYLEDQIREDARNVVESLSRQGINVYMLSGDKRKTAEYVASIVGIPKEKVLAGVKPNEKEKFITELQKDHNIVAMVGDGINDAAALASSHVGVAMGGGVGAASEVSSIVLTGNKLSQLLDALELSRLTMKTVKQNLWWAFAYNIIGIPIAAGMLLPITGTMLTPSIAGALMGLSSIGVMSNSLLLRLKFSSKQKQAHGESPSTKTFLGSDFLMDQRKKMDQSYTDAKWREAR